MVFATLIVVAIAAFVANARANLETRHIASGLGFLSNTASFDVNQALIPFSASDSYGRVLVVGILNTLLAAISGIVLGTLLGGIIALARLSPNPLLARLGGVYVEVIRNLPLLFQLMFWYVAVLAALPPPRQSLSLFGMFFLSKRGLAMPRAVGEAGLFPFLGALVLLVIGLLCLGILARRVRFGRGGSLHSAPFVAGLLALPLLSILLFGAPVHLELPQLSGFNFQNGIRIIPELLVLVVALSTYTAAFIAEIIRAGMLSVDKGQMEAAAALGLSRGRILRLVVLPQAMAVIIPPLTNQYLNLTKNSSLAVAIGYPDIVSVFAGTTLSQTGQAIEIVAITMGLYLLLSLITSILMSLYSARLNRRRLA
ncbi:MAG: ABC transporter permease subunit [Alphaproteobacteria bacterium]|nr:ABC transporter permease subunit [Alphaproteobacteria bacterium]